MDAVSGQPRWRGSAPEDLNWLEFADGFVAYHRPSGKTHLLNEASYILICDVLSEYREFDAIAAALLPDEREPAAEFVAQLESMLARLVHLGLVDRRE